MAATFSTLKVEMFSLEFYHRSVSLPVNTGHMPTPHGQEGNTSCGRNLAESNQT